MSTKICGAAVSYFKDGLTPVHIRKGSKAPLGAAWQKRTYSHVDDVEYSFSHHDGGVGLLLGQTEHGYLVDVDLDSPEAIEAAKRYLGSAHWIHGRESKGDSHYWYFVDREIKTKRYLDEHGAVILEIRGKGSQTLVPPSLHPSGEELRWTRFYMHMHPTEAEAVEDRARNTAGVAYIAQHWPEQGSRQHLVMALTGFLLHSNWKVGEAQFFVETVLRVLGEFTTERQSAITNTVQAFVHKKNVTGGPTVEDILGKRVYDKLVSILDIRPVEYEFGDVELQETGVKSSLISVHDLVSKDVYTQAEVVEGLIWAGKTHWLYSDPNAGKTMLALAVALHVAAGKSFAGRVVQQGPVVIIEEDSSLAVIAGYLDNFTSVYDIDFRELPVYFNEEQGIRIFKPRDVDRIVDLVDSCTVQPSLVIFDSCERILPSNTFNSREVDPLDRLLKDLANRGIANLVLDHTNKSQYENPNDMDVLYGSRAKSAIADIMLQLQGSIKLGALNGTFTKFRGDTPPPVNIYYQMDSGFSLKDRPGGTKTPYEGEVLGYFLAMPGAPKWVREEDILSAHARTPETYDEKRLRRTLSSLSSRRILRRVVEGGVTTYKRNV